MKALSALDFLNKVWPERLLSNEMLELRWRDRETEVVKRDFSSTIPEFLSRLEEHKSQDIYFGVSTRYGTSGKKADCYRVRSVWADLDDRHLRDCVKLSIKPDILVDSGGGVHAYWLLMSPLLVREEGRRRSIEAKNRWLCQRYKGDIASTDVSRILRVPGTFNYKYDPPRLVQAYSL